MAASASLLSIQWSTFFPRRRFPNHETELCPGVHALSCKGEAKEDGHNGHPESRIRRRGRSKMGAGKDGYRNPCFPTSKLYWNCCDAHALCHGN